MRGPILLFALVACGLRSPVAPNRTARRPTACGVERWAQKTMSDPEAARVDAIPENTTVTLLATPGPVDRCHVGNEPRGVGPEEFKTFAVEGVITVAKLEADHDIHIAIADVSAEELPATMIVEVADPACAPHSVIYQELVAARGQLRSMLGRVPLTMAALRKLVGKRVRVVGVGFFDHAHGQSGMARSCQELHPVRSIELVP